MSFRYSVFMDIGLKAPGSFDIPSNIEAYFLDMKFTIINYMEIYSVMSFVQKMEKLDFKIEEVKRQINEFIGGEQRLYLPMLEEGPAALDVEPVDAENTTPAAGADIVEEIKPSATGKPEEFTGGEKGLYTPMLEEGPAVLQVEPVDAGNIIPAAVVDVVEENHPEQITPFRKIPQCLTKREGRRLESRENGQRRERRRKLQSWQKNVSVLNFRLQSQSATKNLPKRNPRRRSGLQSVGSASVIRKASEKAPHLWNGNHR